MQEISAFNYWVMESLKMKDLFFLLPWGCNPFYSPRQARLAKENPRKGVNPFPPPSIPLFNKLFQDKYDGLSGFVCPYNPQNLIKLTLSPRREAIT
jgi:hypothetical protein